MVFRSLLSGSSPRWAISTLGDGAASLEDWMKLCAAWGISELEIRALSGSMDLAETLARLYGTPSEFTQALRGQPAQVTVLSATFCLAVENPDFSAQLLAYAPWAEAAGVPWLRVFDKTGPYLPWTDTEWKTAARQFCWWREERQRNGWKTDIIIEGHNTFFRPEDYRRFCEMIGEEPQMIFDIGHAVRGLGPEGGLAAWEALAPHCPRVHFKDVPSPTLGGSKHCLPGKGVVPLGEFFQKLCKTNPQPVLTFEWERWWQPDLPPLAEALEALRQQLPAQEAPPATLEASNSTIVPAAKGSVGVPPASSPNCGQDARAPVLQSGGPQP